MASLACSQTDLESRYAHLLQPIRDLAKNWDIDLGSQLENYMSEVHQTYVYVFKLCQILKARVNFNFDVVAVNSSDAVCID
jgi:Condensin II complex subunit CAP-H2 or CNDH2, N-terminal